MVHMLHVYDEEPGKQPLSNNSQIANEYSFPSVQSTPAEEYLQLQSCDAKSNMHTDDNKTSYTHDAFNYAMQTDYSPEPCTPMEADSSEFPSGNFCNLNTRSNTTVEQILFSPPKVEHQCPTVEQINPMEVLFGPPKVARQYSISSVMEVIANDAINGANTNTPQLVKTPSAITQPINIKKNVQMGTYDERRATPTTCRVSNTQPSSDLPYACSPAHSNSPMPIPFTGYRNLPDTPQSLQFEVQSNASNSFNENNNVGSFGSTTDNANQAFRTTCHGIQETTNRLQTNTGNWWGALGSQFGSAPTFETALPVHNKLTNVSSCPDFDTNNEVFGDGSDVFQQSPQYSGRAMSASSPRPFSGSGFDFQATASGFELQEVTPEAVTNDISDDIYSQVDRADRRRIRNNLACRASRHRRKLRKINNERLAAGLETQNQELRERIRQLESECQVTRDTVLRRMSET
uniref:Orphan bZip-2 transcription factor protein n=1 Tax=Phallusia mammillata TaxID=59560 RepID=A0A6F9D6G7_9ASCI|nr:Orphan bZip-2 transcription factor protein [Phallusia mammillata]